MTTRREVIVGALGAAATLTAAGCSASAGASPRWADPGTGPGGSPAPSGSASVTISPADEATGVSPADPVVVTADTGTLASVTVTGGGKNIDGDLSGDGSTWRSTDRLAYGQTYTVTAVLADPAHPDAPPQRRTSTFSTVAPKDTAHITFQANALNILHSGATYGMGQVVAVAFSKAVHDRRAAEKTITVDASPSVPGKFFWVNDTIVHWRPKKYWAKGTKVSVTVKAFGVDLGNGVYGSRDASAHFTIGRSLLAKADSDAHKVKVYIDGKLVRTMLCSMGKGGTTTGNKGQTIDFWTRSGPHVVLEKDKVVEMDSASFGITDKNDPNYYDEKVTLCTRISYSGEYLHAAPWNMADHGKRNTSHGCINLSVEDAQWVFDTFIVGDVVEVTNTPKQLPATDGLGDWNVPWSKY